MAITVTIKENAIKFTSGKRFAVPLNFDFFKHSVYLSGLKEDLIVKLELNSSEKVTLCSEDTAATRKLSDVSLEYDERYATTSIPYTKATPIHYQTLYKKDKTYKIDIYNLSVHSFQGLLLLFLDKHDDFVNKNEEFYNPSVKKMLITINVMRHQLFAAGLQTGDIYPELKKYLYKENSNFIWKEFLTTKFGLWADTRSGNDNTLHSSLGAVEKIFILLQIEKAVESSDRNLVCHVLSIEDTVAYLATNNLSGI